MKDALLAEFVGFPGHRSDVIEGYLARPVSDAPVPGMVLLHHAPGLDPWSREVVRRFATEGYACVAPHLYHRRGPGHWADVAAAGRAAGLAEAMPNEQVMGDVAGAAAYLRAQPGSNGKVGATTTYQGHVVDTSKASGGNSSSSILAEVAKQVTAGTIVLDASGNGYYPVYTDLPRGNAGYCAWHSVGTINGTRVQFAFFWSLDGDPGCDPGDTTTGHSQGLAALGNVSAHELSEARSDPGNPGGWYDRQGAENGDKCSWTFNVPNVTFSDGSKWMVQGEWSNAAYTAGTGYRNLSGQKGCIDGH